MAEALIVAGTLAASAAQVKQARETEKSAKFQQKLLGEAAIQREEQGRQQADIQRQQVRRQLAGQVARLGISGLFPGAGSFASALKFSADEGAKIQSATLNKAFQEARSLFGQARQSRKQGKAERDIGFGKATSTLLVGTGKAVSAGLFSKSSTPDDVGTSS